jgi:2,4-dienoyl-CoA reductase-like NADH-dependent reductase (Old Yellow Enzyme family)/thioredoxin reductase
MKYNSPFQLGNMKLKNSYVMAPVKTAYGTPEGNVTPRHLVYYSNLAKGGVSMIILEPTAVLRSGMEHPRQLCIHKDNSVDELKKIVSLLHKHEVHACLNLNHAGRAANPKAAGGPPLAPSALLCPVTGQTPEVLSEKEIDEIISAWGSAAGKAKEAGFDAVEVQCGQGYLIQQFLSSRTNTRKDVYGSDRALFLNRVLDEVEKAARGLTLLIRISADDFTGDGFTEEGNPLILKAAEEKGFHGVHCGLGNACDTPPWYYSHMAMPEEKQIAAVKKIRELTDLPLIAAGRMADMKKLELFEKENIADLVAFGRPLVADPRLPSRLIEGKTEEITWCGYCLQGCLANVKNGKGLGCIVNPGIDREPLKKMENTLNAAVIGAGPAGLAAGTALSRMGHRVTVFERQAVPGGQFRLAPEVGMKQSMKRPLESLVKLAQREISDIRTEREFTLEDSENFDLFILASGSVPVIPSIEGLDSQYVITGVDFFEGKKKVKGKRVLVIGAGMVGVEASEILAARGLEVVAVKRSDTVANDMEPITKKLMLTKLSAMDNVKIIPELILEKFTGDGVFYSRKGEKGRFDPFDTVIVSTGMRPENSLSDGLKQTGKPVTVVGDADTPADIFSAVQSGYSAAVR